MTVYADRDYKGESRTFTASTGELGNFDEKISSIAIVTPGRLAASEIPQMVVLTFDDAVTVTNYPYYETLFSRTKPNG